jgi:alpha-L-rhamnosidase
MKHFMRAVSLKTVIVAVSAMFILAGCTKGGIKVEELRCEYLKNPLAIDSTTPHFSWKMISGKNGAHSTAYQILVATDLSKLNPRQADLWNSGLVSVAGSIRHLLVLIRMRVNQATEI